MSDARKRLRRALASPNRHERAEAAIRLGDAGERDALPELERLADDADDLVAVSALYASWQLGGGVRGVDRMAAALGSPDEETMQLAVMALCEIGEVAVPHLERLLDRRAAGGVEIVRILGEIGGRRAQRALTRAARSGQPAVQRAARTVLDDDAG